MATEDTIEVCSSSDVNLRENEREHLPKDMERNWKKIIGGVNHSPTMVFSVIEGSESNVYRPWPRSVFKKALIEAVKSGGDTWILFRGTEREMPYVVEEAYKNYKDEAKFLKKENDGKIELISLKEKQKENEGIGNAPKTYLIKADMPHETLAEFEKYISEKENIFGIPVPIVILVCGGDIKTIIHISTALKNKIPVIIMKGSGMAADFVVDIKKGSDITIKKARLLIECGVNGEQHIDQETLDDSIRWISKKKSMVSEFDLDLGNPLELSNIVGETVINCWRMQNIDTGVRSSKGVSEDDKKKFKNFTHPYMPNVLNPVDLTCTSPPLHFYYGYHYLQDKDFNNDIGQVLLREALKANHVHYVRSLLDQGVTLNNEFLKDLYISSFKGLEGQTSILGQISKGLADDLLKPSKGDNGTETMRTAVELCRKCIEYSGNGYPEETSSSSQILLWAILANRKEIAEVCWLRGEELLLTGLVCSVLLKKLSEKAISFGDRVLKRALAKHSKLFEKRCILLMDHMYEENTSLATYLMDTETRVWGIYCSPLDFAYENLKLDVVAHPCSQQSMTSQWNNELSPNTLAFLKTLSTGPQKFFSAPRTTYLVHYLIFLVMLVIHSYFVLTSVGTKYYNQNNAGTFECFVYLWVAGDIVEEVITCFGGLHKQHRSKKKLCTRLKIHLNNFWNLLDLFSYVIIILACFIRHFYVDTTFTVARRMFALSLIVMYLRFLEVFLIHKKLGPTLIMIKEMLEDLLSFILIAVFLLLGVGIYYHANIWPDDQTILSGDITGWKIWTILYYPYWQLFAELNLNYLEATEHPDCNKSSMSRCPQEDRSVPVVAAVYLLLSHLLLINLVIAKFSYTFDRIQKNSEKLCWFEMYTATIDYSWRVPSPLNLFFLPYRLFSCLGYCKGPEVSERNKEKEKIMEYQREFQKVIAVKISHDEAFKLLK